MNTRDIAEKLWVYADLLEAELNRVRGLYRLTNSDSPAELQTRLEDEVTDVRAMANELWDKKESI